MYACMYVFKYVCIHVCMSVCVYAYIYMRVCVCNILYRFYLQLYGVGHMVKDHSDSKRKPAAATWATLSD